VIERAVKKKYQLAGKEMPDHNNYMKSVVIGGCDTVLMGQTCFGLRIKW
jgi:hypothetical protein